MGKQGLLALVLAGVLSNSVSASFDGDGCDFWLEGCGLAAYPFLAINNDTRANLLLLASARQGLASPFLTTSADPRSDRAQPFVLLRTLPPTGVDDLGYARIAIDTAKLLQQAEQLDLKLDPGGLKLTGDIVQKPGGRLVSNNAATLSQFLQVLLDDETLSTLQRHALAQQRLQLFVGQWIGTPTPQASELFANNPHAIALQAYLQAAEAFYQQQYETAEAGFQSLVEADQSWVAETARYMLIRLALNRAVEQALDEYGLFDLSKSDLSKVALAVQRADNYIEHYPAGRYVESTRGMYRRLAWFGGDTTQLATQAEQALARIDDVATMQTLVSEIDAKLLSPNLYYARKTAFIAAPEAPLLTMTQALRRLREGYADRPNAIPLGEAELNSYQAQFAKAGMLPAWQYLHATWLFYQQKDPAGVLAAIAPSDKQTLTDPLDFSLQILRGLALQDLDKRMEAEAHWRQLLNLHTEASQRQFLQLMLANQLAHQQEPEKIFAADSPIDLLRFRSLVLKRIADRPLLRQQAVAGASVEERTIALHTLLTRNLQYGDFAAYLQDRPLSTPLKGKVSDTDIALSVFDWDGSDTEPGYHCATLDDTVATLAARPQDGHALNCLGEFFRLTELRINSSTEYGLQWQLPMVPEQSPATTYSRLAYYQQVIANPRAEPEDKSYALYRAILCYAPTGNNQCDEQEIDPETRKAWFQRLKAEYQGSDWERKLRYYW